VYDDDNMLLLNAKRCGMTIFHLTNCMRIFRNRCRPAS